MVGRYHDTEVEAKRETENLPAGPQQTALDAAVNQGVDNTRTWIRLSGGDPAKFNALRRQQYENMAHANPGKYGNPYLKRSGDLRDEYTKLIEGDRPPSEQPHDLTNLKPGIDAALPRCL